LRHLALARARRSEIDWTQCELIEQVPGKVSGRPIVRGTRILPDAIVNSYDAGGTLDDIHEDYPGLSIPQIQRLIEFCSRSARSARPVKLLLDENLPHRLRRRLSSHQAFTVRYMGWAGLKSSSLKLEEREEQSNHGQPEIVLLAYWRRRRAGAAGDPGG
jgi:uncharacterized protein (DUF433 family)